MDVSTAKRKGISDQRNRLAIGGRRMGLGPLGKLLILFGIFLVLIGVLLLLSDKLPWIGRLPGDIVIRKDRFTFYFPLATCILLSLLLTFLFWILRK